MSARPHRPSPLAILIAPVAVAIVLTLFAWPSARLEPRDLPLGVAGPAAAAGALEHKLAAADGAFDVTRYSDEASARRAVKQREVYGAFVATRSGAKVLTASAASPAVAQMLTVAAAGPGHDAATMPVEDVVTAGHEGAALPSSVFPLILVGILTGVLSSLLAAGVLRRGALLVAGSVLAGLAGCAIVQSWLGVIDGSWLPNAGVLSLTVLAIASVVAGLETLFGHAGAAVGALTMMLIGNPVSGVASAPEMLPQPLGALGQLMPPGAGGNLLRSTGFFDGAGAGGHLMVLALWAAAGLVALVAASAKARRRAGRRVPLAA